MQDWKDLRYLQQGNSRQRRAYAALAALALWPTLHAFGPVLAGNDLLPFHANCSLRCVPHC